MKTISVSLLIFLFVFGCGRDSRSDGDFQPRVSSVSPQTVGVETPATPPLSEEQIARNKEITAAIEAGRGNMGDVTNIPNWVTAILDDYEKRYEEHYAFARPFGWGTGSYNSKQFNWFAYTNTDAYLQFSLSIAMAKSDLVSLRGGGREVMLLEKDYEVLAGTMTWIGDSNDWTEMDCVRPGYNPCDIGVALERSVAGLNKDMPVLKLVVKGKFPW